MWPLFVCGLFWLWIGLFLNSFKQKCPVFDYFGFLSWISLTMFYSYTHPLVPCCFAALKNHFEEPYRSPKVVLHRPPLIWGQIQKMEYSAVQCIQVQTLELFTPDGSNMTHNDPGWLCMEGMTYQGSGGFQGVQGGTIKQQNNGSKPWLKVTKVCPDPKGMVFIQFWGIWGHLHA